MRTEPTHRDRIHAAPPDQVGCWNGLDVLVLAPTPTHPINAGNRRRIFFVNDALQRLGARITFMHYPAEGDWRRRVRTESIRAMSNQWYAAHTVPITRNLHESATGEDHTIDEWWDEAIGDMLSWLFRTHHFDVFIVNYAWLSKAFEWCPPGVLKILDTHDRLSDRRDLLTQNGIAPEFFHTTVEQESIALDRADVVWSIKSLEAEFFRTVTNRLVVNIPHVEPIAAEGRPGRAGKVIRFGIAGAVNNINYLNIRAFLAEAETYIRRTLLPCEFVIGGSICDLLHDEQRPWVRLLGRLEDMSDFYAAVDVVLAPISFSTGLKIKVGEALCKGKAVVALAHAFEGYLALHPFHTLPSIAAMLRACRRIVNDPSLIEELEQASIRSVLRTQSEVAAGLKETIAERWRLDRGICIVVDAADVFPGSLVVDHVRETARYVGHLGPIIVYLHGDRDVPNIASLQALAEAGTLVTTPTLREALGPAPEERLGIGLLRVRTLRDLLADPHFAFWFASRPPDWPARRAPREGRAYVACDSVLQSTAPDALPAFVAQLRATFSEVVVLSRRGAPSVERPELASWHHRVPLLWRGEVSLIVGALRAVGNERIVLLADEPTDPLLTLTARLVLNLSDRSVDVVVPDRAFPLADPARAAEALVAEPEDGPRLRVVPATRCFAPSDAGPMGAWLVLDLATDPTLEAVREVFDLAYVPRADLFAPSAAPAHGAWTRAAGARGLFESTLLVEGLLTRAAAADDLREQRAAGHSRGNDAGWAWIWSEVKELVKQAGRY